MINDEFWVPGGAVHNVRDRPDPPGTDFMPLIILIIISFWKHNTSKKSTDHLPNIFISYMKSINIIYFKFKFSGRNFLRILITWFKEHPLKYSLLHLSFLVLVISHFLSDYIIIHISTYIVIIYKTVEFSTLKLKTWKVSCDIFNIL